MGQTNNLVSFADDYGEFTQVYNGVDLNLNARVGRSIVVAGGVSVGTYTTNNVVTQGPGVQSLSTSRCFVVDSPGELRFCGQPVPWLTQVKFLATGQLPHGFQLSGTFQSNPGPTVRAAFPVTNAAASPSLGRNLTAGLATIDLIRPNSLVGERMHQVDIKVARAFTLPFMRFKLELDVFNLFNDNAALLENPNFGPAWRRPTVIMPGRLVKFGTQLSF